MSQVLRMKDCPETLDEARVLIDQLDKENAKLREALGNYMAQFGQALEAHGITCGEAQIKADAAAREALNS